MPESNPNTNKPVSGQTIQVPAPAGGVHEHVTSSPAGELVLGFDPSTATAARPEGSNDLVFELDGGGAVTITDFFVVGDESLPDLKLPDGTVVASADFFEGSGLDISTAVGTIAAPPSSGSDGSGDALSMTTGVDAMGDQGTWHWEQTSTTGDIYEGRAVAQEPAAGPSIIDMAPGDPGPAVEPDRPETPSVPDVPVKDDVPEVTLSTNVQLGSLTVDESFLADGQKLAGDDNPYVTATLTQEVVQAQFGEDFYGADGKGAEPRFSFELVTDAASNTVGSNLYAVDPTFEGSADKPAYQGAEIMLSQNADGSISGKVGTVEYFKITIDSSTGEVKLELKDNIWHSDAADHDDVSTLLGASAETLFLVKTITDGDGDTASARIDLGGEQGVFQFEDDGPQLTLDHAATDADGHVHLGNSYMTEGAITPSYGADMALGAADDYLEVHFEGVRSYDYYDSEGKLATGEDPVSGSKVVEFTDGKSGPVYTGLGVIEFTKNDDGSISYRYLAKHGLKGDSEELTFVVKDGDGDKAEQSVSVTMDHDVPAGTSFVDEAGLTVLGSHHNGYSDASQEFSVFLPQGTTSFAWNVEEINNASGNNIRADVNGDGVYEDVTWGVDDAGNLVATVTVDGQAVPVLTVSPPASIIDSNDNPILNLSQDAGGNWVTDLTVTLHHPVEHASGEGYNTSGLYLGFTATAPGENGELMNTPNAVSVAIVDDAPSALARQITVVETPPVAEDVYLVMDVSGSIKDGSFALGMKALQSLVQKYIDLGIEAKFSLVTFGSNAQIWGNDESSDHLTALEMKAVLDAGIDGKSDSAIATYWRSGQTHKNTNYDVALDATQQLIAKGQGAGDTSFYDQKVYFISDGAPNIGFDKDYASWQAFIQDHAGPDAGNDRVEVYAVGVGGSVNAATMKSVTADGDDHYIKAKSYSDLADKLTDLLQPGSVSGNLFGVDIDSNDPTSADLTLVAFVSYKGVDYPVGEPFEVEPGVTLTVQANGDYTLTSTKNVTEDAKYDLKYTVRDADGDESTADIRLIVKDARPEAFDKVAEEFGGELASHYENGTMFVLDDFAAREGAGDWYYGRATGDSDTLTKGVSFGKTVSSTAAKEAFVDINGDADATPGDSTFVRIDAIKPGSTIETPFHQAFLARAGYDIGELVDRPADIPKAGNYIEQTFDLLTGGNLQFNFLFDRGSTTPYEENNTGEHAFAVLLDEYGNKVWGGVIEPNPDSTSDVTGGLCTIPVENGGKYTLIIGCYDAVNLTNLPSLYVEQLAFTPTDAGSVFTGSMIEDTSYYGETDTMADQARLVAVIVGGVEYAVPVDASLTIEGDGNNGLEIGDKLTISAGGQYYFQTTRESFDDVDISYVLREPGQHLDGSYDQATGTVYIRSEEHKFTDADDRGEHSDGNDVIMGKDGGVDLYGGDGNDVLYGGDGNDTLDGGAGNDVLYGGAGDDHLYGGDGNDILFGGAGNDVIRGGLGSDTMEGGAGSDLFVWKSADYDANTDVINDFTLREDRLSFETLFAEGESNISIKAIQEALGKGQIDISVDANDFSLLNVSVNNGTVTQNVEIHLKDSSLSAEQVNAINMDDDESAKAALLQQMLTGITG